MTSFVLSWLSIMAERISAAVISLNFVAISLVPIPWGLSLCGAALAEAMLYCNDNTAKRPAAARIARPVQAANPASRPDRRDIEIGRASCRERVCQYV